MIVEIAGRNVEVTARLRSVVESRTARLERHVGGSVDVRAILTHQKHRFRAEIMAAHRRGHWVANEETSDPRSALVQAFEKIDAQAVKDSAKRRDRKHSTSIARPSRPAAAAGPAKEERAERASSARNGTRSRIVRVGRRATSAKPMTVEEAAMRIDGSREDFLVFRDSGSEKISVLYKRRDGDFGLVVPE